MGFYQWVQREEVKRLVLDRYRHQSYWVTVKLQKEFLAWKSWVNSFGVIKIHIKTITITDFINQLWLQVSHLVFLPPKVSTELLREDMLFIFTKDYRKKSHWLNSLFFPSNNHSTNGYFAWMRKRLQRPTIPSVLLTSITTLVQLSHTVVPWSSVTANTMHKNTYSPWTTNQHASGQGKRGRPPFSLHCQCPKEHVRPTTVGIF